MVDGSNSMQWNGYGSGWDEVTTIATVVLGMSLVMDKVMLGNQEVFVHLCGGVQRLTGQVFFHAFFSLFKSTTLKK
eukprot:2932678-Ditylum_brightwellii.AAC.1